MYQGDELCSKWVRQQISLWIEEPVTHLQVNTSGWSNNILQVNHRWVLRIPKLLAHKHTHQILRPRLPLEKYVLDRLADTDVGALLPKAELCKLQLSEAHLEVMLYLRLPGEHLKAGSKASASAASQLGHFLARLHSLNNLSPKITSYPYGDEDLPGKVLSAVSALLPKSTVDSARRYFTEWYPQWEQHQHFLVCCHNDLGKANLLFEPDQQRVAGVLDFSDICLADPARDFAALARIMTPETFKLAVAAYRKTGSDSLWHALQPASLPRRMQYYQRRKAIFVVWYAMTFGQPYGFTSQISNHLAWLSAEFGK
ncbi:aminoglycoside phosphotransferase family protein [Shewanella corallii]|uniref:Aminoglycoside phosphotransferase family protein n=1 Tax=Shewanella corallii TaxID=560080 RepID=A0ABT0NE20_9GAMM|nr:aminoglycoside phosphotransferase family protein [Shewanella corallii]MCL2916592.1 aminoglycoside phosphotransferase family protein [Shewanella corallii]